MAKPIIIVRKAGCSTATTAIPTQPTAKQIERNLIRNFATQLEHSKENINNEKAREAETFYKSDK